jgi:hypothetical protein
VRANRSEREGVLLAHDGQCQAQYNAVGNAVQVRVGGADVRLTPAEFLSVCATLLKAARALGQQRHVPGLMAEVCAPYARRRSSLQ